MKLSKPNKNILMTIVILLNLFTLSYLWYQNGVFAETKELDTRNNPPLNVLAYFEKELNLNSIQKEKFQNLRAGHFRITKKLNKEQHELKRMILIESFKLVSDTVLINSATQTIGAIQTKLERTISNHFLELKSICTSEQKKIFNQILEKIHLKIEARNDKEIRTSFKNEEFNMEINNLLSKGPQFPMIEDKNPLREIIGNLPDDKKGNASKLLKSLSKSERQELKSELDSFKSVAEDMSVEERAEGVYEILQNLFGDRLNENKTGDHLIDKYI